MLTDKGKISETQLAFMIFPAILATAILSVPGITMHYAGHDMWLSPIIGSLIGFAAVAISIGLDRLYPGKTLIQSSVSIAGRISGKLIGLVYIIFLPHLTGLIIRTYGEFIVNNALPRTPLFVVMGTMVAVCALNVRLGIEVVGRTSQIFVTLLIVLLSLIFILLIGELNPAELFPFMENGPLPSIKGALAPAAWFSEYIVIAFLLPYVNRRKRTTRVMLGSLILTTTAMTVINLFCLFLIGDLTDSFVYPVMIAARYITIADFLQHIESLIIAVWIFGIFVKISVFLYIFATSTAEWFGLNDYKPVVVPLSFLCMVYAYWVVSGGSGASSLIGPSANLYTISILLILPAMIYGVAWLKKGWAHFRKNQANT
ncbi:endospore germination permease [Paenibacillus sp. 1781tsa1]|uniref:GerAB/ArcD/ProY family transporter n=1 Tax=Paenibacillus sp. 1781tsa1 TaxID=2953810 RepID=UPI00209EDC15|nr:endospore germination permease [Paenibacillus sp. 1781tsa1]MCP1184174.1 spore germination protein [Paenibacillus sp. 1781tsa1]